MRNILSTPGTSSALSRTLIPFFVITAIAWTLLFIDDQQAFAVPTIDDQMMPQAITHLTATGRTVWADQAELAKINAEYGDAYRLNQATYTFDSPDRLEYRTQLGPTNVALITTNNYRLVQVRAGLFKKDVKTDIAGDITKRQTLFALGILPKNYLDTIDAKYLGRETLLGIDCEAFDLRWRNEKPENPMHWIVWIDPDRHYVVKKRLWSDTGDQRETIMYLHPIQLEPNFWMPTRAECYNPEGRLAGAIEYVNVSAS